MLNRISKIFLKFSSTIIVLMMFCFSVHSQTENKSNENSKNELRTTIIYCNFEIPKPMKLANLSFFAVYSFNVNENGEPSKIEKIRDEHIGEDIVKSCISDWRILGFSNKSQFKAYFYWNHNKGWIRQNVSGDNFTQTMETNYLGIDMLKIPEITKKP